MVKNNPKWSCIIIKKGQKKETQKNEYLVWRIWRTQHDPFIRAVRRTQPAKMGAFSFQLSIESVEQLLRGAAGRGPKAHRVWRMVNTGGRLHTNGPIQVLHCLGHALLFSILLPSRFCLCVQQPPSSLSINSRHFDFGDQISQNKNIVWDSNHSTSKIDHVEHEWLYMQRKLCRIGKKLSHRLKKARILFLLHISSLFTNTILSFKNY